MLQLEIENEPQRGKCDTSLKRTFYLAGPMRGYDKCNFPVFDAVRDKGISLGYNIVSPADLDREAGLVDGMPIGDAQFTQEQIDACIDRDLAAIRNLNPETDGLVMLPGYAESLGASAELAVARWRGLEIRWANFRTVLYERRPI
jgi:hypothetical protein